VLNTSCRFEAGSVLISRTFFPLSARVTAVAQAVDVFPTPPLPVKNKYLVNFTLSGLNILNNVLT
jgi:hypothetical protein